MAVGREGEAAGRLQQNAAGEVHGGHPALAEEMHAGAIEPEPALFREEGLGRCVVGVTGHHEPVERAPVAFTGGEDLLGEDLEQRFRAHGGDPKGALRAIVPEPGPLPSRDGERGHLAGAERLLARGAGASPSAGVAATLRPRFVGGGLEVREIGAARARRTEQRAGQTRQLR